MSAKQCLNCDEPMQALHYCEICGDHFPITGKMVDSNSQWIPVEERLPNAGVEVLVLRNKTKREIAWMHKDGSWCHFAGTISHWMPLPPLPE